MSCPKSADGSPCTFTGDSSKVLRRCITCGAWELGEFGVPDWTIDPETGRTNSSPKYNELWTVVEHLILDSAHFLIRGRADRVARLIISQLAHKHGLRPPEDK